MTLHHTPAGLDREVDEDARREAIDERRARARLNHWCEDCRGHSGGPCDEREERDSEETDDE